MSTFSLSNPLVLVAGVIVFVAVLIRPLVGVIILLALLWLTPFYPTDSGATLNRMVGLLVLAGVLLPKLLSHERRKFVFSSFDPGFAFFMFITVLSMFANMIRISSEFPTDRISDLLTGYLLYWLIINVVDSWSQLRALFWLTIICALGLSIPTLLLGMSASQFSMERISIEGNPNYYAFVFLLAILLLLWLSERASVPQKIVLFSMALFLLMGIYFSGNRSSMMSLGVVLLLYGGLLRGAGVQSYLIPVGVAALAGFWIVSQYTPILASRSLQFYSAEDTMVTNDAVRLQIYNGAFRIIRDYPILGVGIGNATTYMKVYMGMRVSIHNMFLGVAAETGILGLAGLLLIYYFILKDLLKIGYSTDWDALRSRAGSITRTDAFHAVILIVGANIIPALTHGLAPSRSWFTVFAFAAVVLRLVSKEKAALPSSTDVSRMQYGKSRLSNSPFAEKFLKLSILFTP